MSLQDKNRRGVSVLIGYVLLVVFAVIISAIVFAWLRSYVPAEALNCPEGTSVFIQESYFENTTGNLAVTIKNNGRFDIAGYFIHASNSSSQEVETIDLSNYSIDRGDVFGNSIVYNYELGKNSVEPGDTKVSVFNLLSSQIGEPYSISIIPVRFQVEDNRERFVSCGDARAVSLVGVPATECVPETCLSLGNYECGDWPNGCYSSISCGTCGSGLSCDASGQCFNASACVPATNPCGTMQCGIVSNGSCGQVNCGPNNGLCSNFLLCDDSGQCVSSCNGTWVPTESSDVECDGGANCFLPGQSNQCQCPVGYEPDGNGGCVVTSGSPNSCPSYCLSLGYDGPPLPEGICRQEPPKCTQNGEIYAAGGDVFCGGGAQSDTCCCRP